MDSALPALWKHSTRSLGLSRGKPSTSRVKCRGATGPGSPPPARHAGVVEEGGSKRSRSSQRNPRPEDDERQGGKVACLGTWVSPVPHMVGTQGVAMFCSFYIASGWDWGKTSRVVSGWDCVSRPLRSEAGSMSVRGNQKWMLLDPNVCQKKTAASRILPRRRTLYFMQYKRKSSFLAWHRTAPEVMLGRLAKHTYAHHKSVSMPGDSPKTNPANPASCTNCRRTQWFPKNLHPQQDSRLNSCLWQVRQEFARFGILYSSTRHQTATASSTPTSRMSGCPGACPGEPVPQDSQIPAEVGQNPSSTILYQHLPTGLLWRVVRP